MCFPFLDNFGQLGNFFLVWSRIIYKLNKHFEFFFWFQSLSLCGNIGSISAYLRATTFCWVSFCCPSCGMVGLWTHKLMEQNQRKNSNQPLHLVRACWICKFLLIGCLSFYLNGFLQKKLCEQIVWKNVRKDTLYLEVHVFNIPSEYSQNLYFL